MIGMIDVDRLRFSFGEYANDVIRYSNIISEHRNHSRSEQYKTAMEKLLSYYIFDSNEEDEEYLIGDMLLEKNSTIENINMTKTQFIALIRTGVIIAPKKDFVGSRK